MDEATEAPGGFRISEEVVAAIAGLAASEVPGVAGLTGGFVGDITEMLGKRSFGRGVRVELGTREAAIDLSLVVQYGISIPAVAQAVQERVKAAVESMTGLAVVEVNVHVRGVSFEGAEPSGREVRVR
ncbi:MAG: Asp23/Gls24 family envelope stress response protein [Clostridia bacterium]|nr:Asp23/Gls24 family envelope stress response protein [Clostridia bacterium]